MAHRWSLDESLAGLRDLLVVPRRRVDRTASVPSAAAIDWRGPDTFSRYEPPSHGGLLHPAHGGDAVKPFASSSGAAARRLPTSTVVAVAAPSSVEDVVSQMRALIPQRRRPSARNPHAENTPPSAPPLPACWRTAAPTAAGPSSFSSVGGGATAAAASRRGSELDGTAPWTHDELGAVSSNPQPATGDGRWHAAPRSSGPAPASAAAARHAPAGMPASPAGLSSSDDGGMGIVSPLSACPVETCHAAQDQQEEEEVSSRRPGGGPSQAASDSFPSWSDLSHALHESSIAVARTVALGRAQAHADDDADATQHSLIQASPIAAPASFTPPPAVWPLASNSRNMDNAAEAPSWPSDQASADDDRDVSSACESQQGQAQGQQTQGGRRRGLTAVHLASLSGFRQDVRAAQLRMAAPARADVAAHIAHEGRAAQPTLSH